MKKGQKLNDLKRFGAVIEFRHQIARFRVHDEPFAAIGGQNDDGTVGRETGRLDRMADMFVPNQCAAHRVH